MLLAEIEIDVVTLAMLIGSALVTLVGAVAGYATLRADVRRDRERIDALEVDSRGFRTEFDGLREWRAFLKGQQTAGKRSTSSESTETGEFKRR